MTNNTVDTCTISVTGMTCGGCSGGVQRVLERSPGVTSASVDLASGNAKIEYKAGETSPERLVEAIRGIGYGAELQPRDA